MSDNTLIYIVIAMFLLTTGIMVFVFYKPNLNAFFVKTYVYIASFLIAFVLLYFSFKQYSNTNSLLSTGVKTTAKIIEIKELGNNRRVRPSGMSDLQTIDYVYPVFEFLDIYDRTITIESEIASNIFSYKIGDTVTIIYSQDNSSEIKIFSLWGLYRWSIILLGFAFPILFVGAWAYYTKT